MSRRFLYLSALIAIAAAGCKGGGTNTGSLPADTLAQRDPNAKAAALLDQLAKLPPEEREGWAQRSSNELSVFQNVTDPKLRARYDTEIAPLLGGR